MPKLVPKVLLPLLIAASFVTPVRADLGTVLRSSPFFRSASLRAVQLRLCSDYRHPTALTECLRAGTALRELIAFSSPFSREERARLAGALDLTATEANEITVTAIHTDRLTTLLSESKTVAYLKDLAFYHRYDSPRFNLWETSLKLSPSPESALERVAVLFQDFSQSREHLHWAIAKGLPNASVEALGAANEDFVDELKIGFTDAVRDPATIAKYYPAEVAAKVPDALTPGVYHFYSAAYWAMRLRQAGFSRADAILQAFGVHLAYEVSSQNRNLWPIGHLPHELDSEYKAWDLASAYWGALYGASIADGRPFPGTPGLASALRTEFREVVRELLK